MERRRQERYCIDAPIKIIRDEGSISTSFDASCKDISSAGVFVTTSDTLLRQNQKVHLELTLTIEKLKDLFGGSSKVTLKLDGVVARYHGNGIVIELEDNYSILPLAI